MTDRRARSPLAAHALRARVYTRLRSFFAERSILEVETPILSAAGNTAPNIDSFVTTFDGHVESGARERWLRTSPEHALKRLLAAGIGDCYELGRVFRNGEAGRQHNPEFTLLEWYRVGWDHHRLIGETIELVQATLGLIGRRADVAIRSYREWFVGELAIDPFEASIEALRAPLAEFRIDPTGLGRDDWLDLLLTHRLQPTFPHGRISVIHGYPPTQAALARIERDGEWPTAQRFELYLGRSELANGYHELADPVEQRARFVEDNRQRARRGMREPPIDEALLGALANLPECAGVALGVDRLLMSLADSGDIAEVLALAFDVA